ncbi:MAG: bifunctional acetate--CoA ligase family protein/GNAT family N-acetyltransferase [Candidatus Eisenbacteria bacterium]|nr:bifunctional acetate--CoA ligase family protein/GNAT family N-acetyltransferase [Candidatus Eisenbacteria bacterium]
MEPMNVHGLDSIFNPRRIALVGVTINPNSVGGRVLANLVGGGFQGVVYPVNEESEAVMGVPCYPRLQAVPRTPDLAVICAPAEQVPDAVRQCGDAGVNGIIIMSAGFKETGEEGRRLEDRIKEERRRFPGMRIIGPNCLGIIVPGRRLNVSFASGMPKAGNVAFVSQSGALCTSVLDWAIEGKIGFSHFVSIGNTVDVDFGDLIDYFGNDPATSSIICYIESIENARRFMTAARAFARSKPILAYKAGRFPESAKVAASHTGALASEDAVYDAAFQRIGLTRVYDIGDIFDCAEMIGRNKIPLGPRLAIVTNAGGPGVMATDALLAEQGVLAELSPAAMAQLDANLPAAWSHRNPIDVLGDANPKRMQKAVEIVLADPGVDAVLVIVTPQAMTNPTGVAKAIAKLAATTPKPLLAAWLGGATMREGIGLLTENGIPAYRTPEQAVRAFMTLVAYARNLTTLYETPKDIPVALTFDRDALRTDFLPHFERGGAAMSETISKTLLHAYGIPVTLPLAAATADEATRAAAQLGYPVVLKILSPDITHKTDVGGVALDLEDERMVRDAFERIMHNAQVKAPEASLLGVTVQPMVDTRDGMELILGIKKDPVFGTVLMTGMGGVAAEVLGDRSLGFPPLNERLARLMLESLKIWPLLRGYRGRPPVNLDMLIEVLIRLSYVAADFPEIAELDINPLLVTPRDVVALDARIILDPVAMREEQEPYAHLALHPYPEKYVQQVTLKDGTPVTFRPIKPEDEPLWLKMLASCSKESIYSRFRHFFHWQSHEVATRFCYIDYNREIAIVAEIVEDGERKLIGVGRLIADPDHESVEYAVLIVDAWQKRELGSRLTDYCMDVARKWKLKRIVAQTTSDNRPMIAVFQKRGFTVTHSDEDTTVDVVREIGEEGGPAAQEIRSTKSET